MPTRGKEQWKKSTFYCAGRKATLATGRKFWQEQFVRKGRRGRGHGFCLASTSQTPTRSLPPRTAAAHGTKRHTWSRWLSKNKGFYQFVCHPSTIYLCNVSSHSSTLFLKHFPFASKAPMVGTHSRSCRSNGRPKQGSSCQHMRKSRHMGGDQSTGLVYKNFIQKTNPKQLFFFFFNNLNTQNFSVWHCLQQSPKLTQLTGQWCLWHTQCHLSHLLPKIL